MSISLNANFELLSAGLYLDARQQFNTIIEMKDFAETSTPDGFITYNKETQKHYVFSSSNTVDAILGKWREYNSGGGSSEKQIKDWVSGSSYLEGDYIYHWGELYRCLTSNSDVDFDESNWEQITYGIDELSKEDVERLLGLTKEEIEAMASLISDTEVRIDKTYSSSKIYTDIQQCLEDSKTYTLEELEKVKIDDTLTTTDKTITGAINEVNGNLLDTVGFSADYKNIILNRKNGLNPYTIPISTIINNASLTELKDIDGTDIGNGKTIVYNSVTQKHKYVNATLTDEFVKMDSATDAHYLADLIDKSTIVNENGILKVKMLDGQDVTIAEINHLKGLTMNVMDLVNSFANGGVKVLNTPVATYADLITLDRSAFVEGISYIVYVLADETHTGAKTTYLCDKTSSTYFGIADGQRNFTTNPIDLANEVTGKLDNSHIDVDSLWNLLTINDTYKTLTTKNEVFGTHGAKALYDELVTEIGAKANTSDIPTKVSELTNDSNYQTAKQVNSAVTTEIAKVETELKGSIEEINDSLVDKQDFRIFKSLEEFNEKKGTSFTVVSGVDNMVDIANAMSEGDMLIITTKYITGSEIYFGLDSSTGWTKIFTLTRIVGLCDIKCTTSAVKNLTRVLAGSTLTDWQEVATMDRVKDGYAKIIKNSDTDAHDAMFIAYKNRDLFGIRIYKDDYSEHELRFNASDISYVKNGVTVWTTSGNTGNTGVADVPKTSLTPVFPREVVVGSTGVNINYIVRNGWCNINFEFSISSATTFSWTDIATGLPKPENSLDILLMNEGGKINRPIPIKINSSGTVSAMIPAEITTTDWWNGNISYPVAE